ncbi:MAG: hypothetical protein JNL39_21700 [Opitutaceae bacterium]|nr:hypothetical protein [Opitutaceae bacterium]
MFRRLLLEDHAAIFTIAAFITAASIFGAFLWRALRMQSAQVERFENLPFASQTPAARHDADTA